MFSFWPAVRMSLGIDGAATLAGRWDSAAVIKSKDPADYESGLNANGACKDVTNLEPRRHSVEILRIRRREVDMQMDAVAEAPLSDLSSFRRLRHLLPLLPVCRLPAAGLDRR